jgi:hypothetical protein
VNIDRLIDSLLEDRVFIGNKGQVVKFEFTSYAQDDLEEPHVAGTAKLTGYIVDGDYEMVVIQSDNPQIGKGEVLYLPFGEIKTKMLSLPKEKK